MYIPMTSTSGDRSKIDITYEIIMILLAATSVGTLWYDTGVDSYLIWGTWGVFFLDFLYRLFTSRNKWEFIKSNPFIVIAVIPLDALFQMARAARILHLLRLKTITKYYTMPFIRFLKQQNISLIISLSFLMLFIVIIPLYYLEPEINSFIEAFWSGLLSFIFFGRSNFEPSTMVGNIVLVLLSILGVVLYGLVISTIFDVKIYSSVFKKLEKTF
ncbi:hypothetical protein ACE1TI_11205 [Alteribacillus sp. JSM 102045]|uniref:hypothetical protein n=1 Tax=Alteribacillus sp. JSM 102045 TaxID=1562101 RepID=UPI0035BF8388